MNKKRIISLFNIIESLLRLLRDEEGINQENFVQITGMIRNAIETKPVSDGWEVHTPIVKIDLNTIKTMKDAEDAAKKVIQSLK